MPAAARLVGVDAARGLAIVGMIWAHTADDGSAESLADGRSSVLFAVLAGVSLGLMSGGPRPARGPARSAARRTVALRGMLLVALGLTLWAVGTPVAVILDSYGALFLVLLPVLFAPVPVVAAVAIVAAVAGPLLVAAVGPDLRTPFSPEGLPHLLGEWFVTGYYPGAVWAAYVCAGLVVARLDLAAQRTQVAVLLAGGAASLLGYGLGPAIGLDASAHADTVAEVLGAGGLALAVVGLLQLATTAPAVRRVLAPLTAAGSMPLTVYTGQILVLGVWLSVPTGDRQPSIASWPLLIALELGSLTFATLWRRGVGRGPMEQLMGWATRVRPADAVRPVA